MNHRALGALVALVVFGLSVPLVSGQAPQARANRATGGTIPRTIDGHPDLQGFWTNDTLTPLERPTEFGEKAVLTREEAAAYAKKRLAQYLAQPKDDIHYDDAIWQSEKTPKGLNGLRTSLVVDPSDGRIPAARPEAQKRADTAAAERRKYPPTSILSRGLTERCITSINLTWSHDGAPLLPEGYNSNLRITQAPGYVVIETEMVHNARIIPLDGRPHIGTGVRQYIGDYRGRWEGTTLVIENTNFTDKTPFRGSTAALKVTERITPIDADTLLYRATVEDPNTWARPWTIEYPIVRTPEPIYEYACHEGNYGVANILRAAGKE